jgi:O-acetylserine/cysteine efflux transporter
MVADGEVKTVHVLLLVLVAVIWGLNFVVIRVGLDNFPPLLFSALRFMAAALPWCLFIPRPQISWALLAGIGGMLCVVKFSLLFVAMDVGLSPGLASLLLQSQAAFTLMFATLAGERPGGWQVAGLGLSLCGVVLIGSGTGGDLPATGLVLALLAAAAWAGANMLMRRAGAASMLAVVVWASAIAPVPLVILSIAFDGWHGNVNALLSIDAAGLAAVAYVAYAATLFGFAAWGSMIRRYGAARVAPFSLLVPLAGMSASALLLGEEFGPDRMLAAALIVGGVGLGLRKPRTASRQTVSGA